MINFNPKFDIRNHAVEQFSSRKKFNGTLLSARIYLNQQINKQVYKLKEKTRSGEDQWHVPSAKCILISKYENGTNIVVTIINDVRVVSEESSQEDFMEKLSKFDTYSKNTEILSELVKANKTQILEKISSRTKLHKAKINGTDIIFTYNTNSKNIIIITEECSI